MKHVVKDMLSFLGRLALSAALMAWLFTQIDWKDITTAVRGADPVLLFWAFVVTVAIQFVVLWRWAIFMWALNLQAPLGQVCRYFFIGLFCNLFLPTSIGGDVVKAIGLSRGVGQKPKVFASVVLDRLSGFAGLVIVALLAYVVGTRIVDAPSVLVPIVVLTVLSVTIGGILFSRRIYAIGCRVFHKIPKAHKALLDMHNDVLLMTGRKRTGFGCIALSCLIQILGAFLYYLIGRALHLEASFLHYLIFAPIVGAITFLPSIGGLGVREVGWVYFLAKVGVDKGAAASLSLISFFFVIICGLIGGVVYVTTVSDRRIQSDPQGPAAD
ncbi:MAG: flippase-like domain-containing protein [Candidatus Omnitrophica bacterium]|nr:flippase-like domain-containing protein [Candidatus Omnitrophota bacterium]